VHSIELDVHLSREGIPVVIHDATLDRTAKGHGNASVCNGTDLRKLAVGAGEPIPTLRDVPELVRGQVHLGIEAKAGSAADAVRDEVEKHPVSIGSCPRSTMMSRDPSARLGWTVSYGR